MRKNLNKIFEERIGIVIIATYMIGLLIGAFLANNVDAVQQSELQQYIYNGFANLKQVGISYKEYFMANLMNHLKLIVFIWILGYIPYGYVVSVITIFIKGCMYGFTEAFLTSQFGLNGLLIGFLSYLPQNIIFIPALYILSKMSIRNSFNNKNINKGTKNMFQEYILLLIVIIVCFVLGTIIETYISPKIIKYFLYTIN